MFSVGEVYKVVSLGTGMPRRQIFEVESVEFYGDDCRGYSGYHVAHYEWVTNGWMVLEEEVND